MTFLINILPRRRIPIRVHRRIRWKGPGDAILKKAESIAIQRGCRRAFLTTFEFQARSFYEKRGYTVSGKLEGYPPGSTYYWMVKDLGRGLPA